MPQQNASTLTVESDRQTWLVQDDDWREINMADGFFVGTPSPAVRQSSATLTLPNSIDGGSYRVCTLPLQDAGVLCATLTVS